MHIGNGVPRQEWSSPSHAGADTWHWHTSVGWPISGAQLQPGTQSATEAQLVVHTLPEPPLPVSAPTGWQIPLGQSEFLLHGIPVPFAGAPPSPDPASPAVVPSGPASCGAEASSSPSAPPLELPLASLTATHTAPSHANPAAQL